MGIVPLFLVMLRASVWPFNLIYMKTLYPEGKYFFGGWGVLFVLYICDHSCGNPLQWRVSIFRIVLWASVRPFNLIYGRIVDTVDTRGTADASALLIII